jgi:hypothetical protein
MFRQEETKKWCAIILAKMTKIGVTYRKPLANNENAIFTEPERSSIRTTISA